MERKGEKELEKRKSFHRYSNKFYMYTFYFTFKCLSEIKLLHKHN